MAEGTSLSTKDFFIEKLNPIGSYIKEETLDAFIRIIDYYIELESIKPQYRSTSGYNLTSAYALLLLNSTYDLSIKEIYRSMLKNSLTVQESTLNYLTEVIDTKILNRYMTNIKHDVVKKSLKVSLSQEDNVDTELQKSISTINNLIEARNNIAHSIEVNNKGHNDLKEALESVIYYLNWYCNALKIKFGLMATG